MTEKRKQNPAYSPALVMYLDMTYFNPNAPDGEQNKVQHDGHYHAYADDNISLWAIILAAGLGTRLQEHTQGLPKQFVRYKNLPLYMHCAMHMRHFAKLRGLIFVFPKTYLSQEKTYLHSQNFSLGLTFDAVSGGERRQDSVQCGLRALPPECTHVLVHDAARPFFSSSLLQRIYCALKGGAKGVIPALPVVDTIKEATENTVIRTLPRHKLFAVQTPQGFERKCLEAAHAQVELEGLEVTDDAGVLEACGYTVQMVEGEASNTKITHVEDLMKLENKTRLRNCVGFGYDVHRFAKNNDEAKARPLILGGVLMDGACKVLAHSDGDVLLHALMDALLGAASLGDIGLHFPDTAESFDNADSAVLLQEVLRLVRAKGLHIEHVDLTIISQKPKINPQRMAIKKNVAHLLSLDAEQVNVKATTEEGLGFTGNLEGLKATALVTCLMQVDTENIWDALIK